MKRTIRSSAAAQGQLSAAVSVVLFRRIALVSSAHGDSRGKKGVLFFWAASGGCDHDEKSMIHGERWVGVGVGPVVHDGVCAPAFDFKHEKEQPISRGQRELENRPAVTSGRPPNG